MPTVIVIHWNEPNLALAVVEQGQVVARPNLTITPGLEPIAIGQQLAETLAAHSVGRAKTIVAVSRSLLEWQHLSLPPCPADELTDLVRLQSERDPSTADEELGFDYIPLVGDEQTQYQVLTVDIDPNKLSEIRQACQAADLTLERVVPLSVGWPAIATHHSPTSNPGTHIFVTPESAEATIWATHAGRVILFRQVLFAATDDPAALASSVGSELRRTLLALSQNSGPSKPAITLVGQNSGQLTKLSNTLEEQLGVATQILDVSGSTPDTAHESPPPNSQLPLLGIAINESHREPPLVDFLHPRRRPKAQVNVRTYALAATAAVLLISWLGWMGYSKLQAPLDQAAADQAELTLLQESLDELNEAERHAASIRDWNAETANLLIHLQQISQSTRPKPLDSKDFSLEQDVLFHSFGLDKRRLEIDAFARNSRAIQPLESRLRAVSYRPQRGKSDPSQTVKGYPWHFKSTIELTPASDQGTAISNETSTEQPQS